jgi:hypothetical protein
MNSPASAVYRSTFSNVLDALYVRGISVALARGGFFKRTGGFSKSIAGLFGESQDGCHAIQFRSAFLNNKVAMEPAWRSTVARLASTSTHQRRKSDG